MANAFRSAFYVSAVITLITLPAIFVGFFPITLFMAIVSLSCLVLWRTMHNKARAGALSGGHPHHGHPVQTYEPTAGVSPPDEDAKS